jgi:hypothetical protein
MIDIFTKGRNSMAKRKHDPDEVALVMDITGHCTNCNHDGMARLVAYYSGEILIRCNNCRKAGGFVPDDATYNDPNKFRPFHEDEDDAPLDEGQGRYTKGRR